VVGGTATQPRSLQSASGPVVFFSTSGG
jgi:hypothetical protein